MSAVRKNGITQFIRIKSFAGEPCRLRCDLPSPVHTLGPSGKEIQKHDGLLELNLAKNEEVVLYGGNIPPDLKIEPVATAASEDNPWGVH